MNKSKNNYFRLKLTYVFKELIISEEVHFLVLFFILIIVIIIIIGLIKYFV